ncbi:MAG: aspartate carbamoyltransferase catalytic subunit [Acidobacteria bacterium]|jgi:aspartate carbamoyltransferase catalytic subunit|nr:aspartate carbamoyltransferase catalytic subunit [Candidatus Sulfomarinibacter sp. MAG AM1]
MPVEAATALGGKDLVGIGHLSVGEIQLILDTAEELLDVAERPIKKVPALRGSTVVNLFMEPSTRTRFSFEVAEKRLSADTLNFSSSGSSVSKGETLFDTARNLMAMAPDFIVIRHPNSGAPHRLAGVVPVSIINAGDGINEHPTQALLDALTMRQRFDSLEGLKVVIAGDIRHSRVARSNAFLLAKMGAEVRFVAPASLLPLDVEDLGVSSYLRIEPALEGADVVMMLRIQLERQKKINFPSMREYFDFFALTPERLLLATDHAVVMHPGPMNRGVEIDSSVADGEQSLILDQVTNGVAIRMAILYLLAGGRSEAASDS